jgi:hypothetical protein
MDDRNRLPRSAVAPVRAMLGRRRLAESREPRPAAEATGVPREPRYASPRLSPRANYSHPLKVPNRLANRKFQ